VTVKQISMNVIMMEVIVVKCNILDLQMDLIAKMMKIANVTRASMKQVQITRVPSRIES
jgi:hypothetical protein